ncbi:MarR family transcriptional regulator [Blastococcus sp. CCUG 61487]|uniref:MarR family winged helix-turn-helix transcriptional regulator n=1 Tax=Blastococcus sp. CCUG 61487 TaxID=1840703 RepID=UPI0010BF7147|nr:MarR family transcriptional regulator [Blastococcus sp. CCUG 61487]TKJ28519.1 MarR family transcriptional regulator [Blastococcus sp. CCUG 61487]
MPISPDTRDRLTASIAHLVRTGRQVSMRAAAQLHGELPSYGWALLLPLEQDGEQRCSALASRAGIDVSVASRQLAALERSGYVDRRPDPRDGRASLFFLTPRGEQALAGARAVRADWALGALSGWDEDDARRLIDLIDRLADDVGASVLPTAPAQAAR